MNVKKRSLASAEPMTRTKNAGSPARGGANQAKPIKNAVAMKPTPATYKVAKNSVTCL